MQSCNNPGHGHAHRLPHDNVLVAASIVLPAENRRRTHASLMRALFHAARDTNYQIPQGLYHRRSLRATRHRQYGEAGVSRGEIMGEMRWPHKGHQVEEGKDKGLASIFVGPIDSLRSSKIAMGPRSRRTALAAASLTPA